MGGARMNRRFFWMFPAGLLLMGCASAQPAPPAEPGSPAGSISLRLPNTMTKFDHVVVTGDRISGPNLELSRYGDVYRGRAYGEIVDLEWEGDTLVGRIGNGMGTALRFREYADGYSLEGQFSGGRGFIALRGNLLKAVAGARRFDLVTDDGLVYRDVRYTVRPMEVVLSPEIAALPTREQAVALAMFLRH